MQKAGFRRPSLFLTPDSLPHLIAWITSAAYRPGF